MSPNRTILSLSLPPEMSREIKALAKKEGKTKSALLRDMIQLYRRQKQDDDFRRLQEYGSKKARKLGIKTEADIERIVFGGR
jgi:predicted DNA-binding protein